MIEKLNKILVSLEAIIFLLPVSFFAFIGGPNFFLRPYANTTIKIMMFVSILALLSGWFLIVRYLYGGTKLLCTTNKILIALSCGGAVVVIIGIVCVILGYEDYLMFIVFGSPASIPFIHMFLIWIPKNNANKSLQPTANAPAELNR